MTSTVVIRNQVEHNKVKLFKRYVNSLWNKSFNYITQCKSRFNLSRSVVRELKSLCGVHP